MTTPVCTLRRLDNRATALRHLVQQIIDFGFAADVVSQREAREASALRRDAGIRG